MDYIVRDGRIEIVDEFTGRVMEKRHWPDGIQAAVEAKEGLARRTEGRILGTITLQHFLGLYPRLAGMTATAVSSADELREFYGLGVTIVPPHRPNVRQDLPDAVFSDREAKRRALVSEIASVHATGRPILVGTLSVRESEELSADLAGGRRSRIPILNAKNDEAEAGIIAEAGAPGAVTISTNMAGRGIDIKLGGSDERDREAGRRPRRFVCDRDEPARKPPDRPPAPRPLRPPGRSGFDPVFHQSRRRSLRTVRPDRNFFPAPSDRAADREEIGTAALRREIAHAQRVIEGQNFDIRRTLRKFSSLVRDPADGSSGNAATRPSSSPDPPASGKSTIRKAEPGPSPGSDRTGLDALERRTVLPVIDRAWADHLAWIADTRESIHLVSLGGKTPIQEFTTSATDAFLAMMTSVEEEAGREFDRLLASGRPGPPGRKIPAARRRLGRISSTRISSGTTSS